MATKKTTYIYLTIVSKIDSSVKVTTIELTREDRDNLLQRGQIFLEKRRELSLTIFEYYMLIV